MAPGWDLEQRKWTKKSLPFKTSEMAQESGDMKLFELREERADATERAWAATGNIYI